MIVLYLKYFCILERNPIRNLSIKHQINFFSIDFILLKNYDYIFRYQNNYLQNYNLLYNLNFHFQVKLNLINQKHLVVKIIFFPHF